MSKLCFDGRVALITGAGGGLGKCYALAFAERGASVVVNDLGGSTDGLGESKKPADVVVDLIKRKGGKAVSNYDSVEDGEAVVKSAIKAFGRIDIVVNNAGILRDKSFAKMEPKDWDLIHQVHLRGSFMVTKAAWPYMRKQAYGKIIMTSSNAGILGNFGQANYSAAKMGLIGLSNTLAIEGSKYGINSNVIIPTAGSRLTLPLFPPGMMDVLQPEFVCPMVVYLCHENCSANGGLFEAAAGWAGQLRWQKTKGALLLKDKTSPVSVEDIRDNWDQITDFGKPIYHSSIQEATSFLVNSYNDFIKKSERRFSGSVSKPTDAVGFTLPDETFQYSPNDAILYALGVGVKTSNDSLKYLFEGHEQFSILPTFGVVPAQTVFSKLFAGEMPGFESLDISKILHGEQYLELYKPIPTNGSLRSVATIAEVLNKGSGALVVCNVDSFDENDNKILFNQFCIFIVGAGNFDGPRKSKLVFETAKPPNRVPDATVTEQTSESQAALYRLNGDLNPLHIDPNFAMMGGFSTPILHGLCSFGYASRHVLEKFAGNDVSKFKAIKARFSKPVLPGQTLCTEMWKEGSRVHFICKVVETNEICLSGGYVDLKDIDQGPVKVENDVINELRNRVNAALVQKIGAVYLLQIKANDNKTTEYIFDLKHGSGKVFEKSETTNEKPDCTLTLDEGTLNGMFEGSLNAQKAFMNGKLRISGNMAFAIKLGELFKNSSKL